MSLGVVPAEPGEPVQAPGRSWRDYRLLERVGKGGSGEVWKAEAPGGFHVALKFVPLVGRLGGRELRSLDILKMARHPNLLVTFGAWVDDEVLVIAMELADRTLWDRYREAAGGGSPGLPRDELLGHLGDAAAAIDYLNEFRHVAAGRGRVGIQHRDIKPGNILLVGGGAKVGDLGMARLLDRSVVDHTGSCSFAYAAPEFFRNRTARSSDQYSLAVTYCQLRTGRLPFSGSAAGIVLGQLMNPPDLTRLGEAERRVVGRALSKEPADRWPNCRAFIAALRECPAAPVADERPRGGAGVAPWGPPASDLQQTSSSTADLLAGASSECRDDSMTIFPWDVDPDASREALVGAGSVDDTGAEAVATGPVEHVGPEPLDRAVPGCADPAMAPPRVLLTEVRSGSGPAWLIALTAGLSACVTLAFLAWATGSLGAGPPAAAGTSGKAMKQDRPRAEAGLLADPLRAAAPTPGAVAGAGEDPDRSPDGAAPAAPSAAGPGEAFERATTADEGRPPVLEVAAPTPLPELVPPLVAAEAGADERGPAPALAGSEGGRPDGGTPDELGPAAESSGSEEEVAAGGDPIASDDLPAEAGPSQEDPSPRLAGDRPSAPSGPGRADGPPAAILDADGGGRNAPQSARTPAPAGPALPTASGPGGAAGAMPVGSASALNDSGLAHFRAGRTADAIAAFNEALELDPRSAVARKNRGAVLWHERRYAEAIADFDAAVRINPGDPVAYNNRGLARRASGDFPRALADYNTAIRLDPSSVVLLYNRAQVLAQFGRDAEAIADLSRAIRGNPGYGKAYQARAEAYARRGDRASAEADLARARGLGSAGPAH